MQGPSELVWTGNLRDYDRTSRLHEIAIPTLFLSGRYGLVPPATSAWFQSLLPASELVVFEQSAELPFLEEPARYFQIVRDFLRQVEFCQ
jgi:proline iminopeptidase